MLAATRPTRRGKARRRAFGRHAGRLAALALARPGTVVLTLLFCGVGTAISVNALWLQTQHRVSPRLRQAAQRHGVVAGPPTPPARRISEAAPAAPQELHPHEAETTPAAKPAPKPAAKPYGGDAIGDLIGTVGPAPIPPERPARLRGKQAPTRHAQARPSEDALAALIERTSASR